MASGGRSWHKLAHEREQEEQRGRGEEAGEEMSLQIDQVPLLGRCAAHTFSGHHWCSY
jgi:hypothetical protein